MVFPGRAHEATSRENAGGFLGAMTAEPNTPAVAAHLPVAADELADDISALHRQLVFVNVILTDRDQVCAQAAAAPGDSSLDTAQQLTRADKGLCGQETHAATHGGYLGAAAALPLAAADGLLLHLAQPLLHLRRSEVGLGDQILEPRAATVPSRPFCAAAASLAASMVGFRPQSVSMQIAFSERRKGNQGSVCAAGVR